MQFSNRKLLSFSIIKLALVLFICLLFVPTNLYAAPAYDGFIELQQPSKFTFKARLYGDEWYNWVETNNGYGIYQNMATGNWEYYLPSAGEEFKGRVASSLDGSTAVVGDADPIVLGIPKGLRPPRRPPRPAVSPSESAIDNSPMIGAPVRGTKYVRCFPKKYAKIRMDLKNTRFKCDTISFKIWSIDTNIQ